MVRVTIHVLSYLDVLGSRGQYEDIKIFGRVYYWIIFMFEIIP